MKTWIIGDFATGETNESQTLPFIHNTDSIQVDINSGDNVTLNLPKNDLPEDWKTYLKTPDKFIALVDTDKAYNEDGAVLFCGFINKVNGALKETVSIQAAGAREYASARIISNLYTGTVTDPNTAIKFEADTFQGLMAEIVSGVFSSNGIPSTAKTPPAMLGTVDGSQIGTTYSYEVKLSDFMSYSSALDDIRDVTSAGGNEYRFTPRWQNADKNKIVWDVIIGTDSQPQIKANENLTIILDDSGSFKHSAFSMGLNSAGMANRILSQSQAGDEEAGTGADITVKTSTAGASVLLDTVFNPGVELTSGEMDAQLSARLTSILTAQGEATYVIEEADPAFWLNQLGKLITFTGVNGTDSEGFNITVRCTDLSFSASNSTIEVGVMVPQPRYPKLPRSRTGGNTVNGEYPNYSNPVISRPVSNKPISTGGGGGVPVTPVIPPILPQPNDVLTFTEKTIDISSLSPFSGATSTENGSQIYLSDWAAQIFIKNNEYNQIGNASKDVIIKQIKMNDDISSLMATDSNFRVFPASLIGANRKTVNDFGIAASTFINESIVNKLYYNPFNEKLYIFFLQSFIVFDSENTALINAKFFHSFAYTINLSTAGVFTGDWKKMFRLGDEGDLDEDTHYFPSIGGNTFGGVSGKNLIFLGVNRFENWSKPLPPLEDNSWAVPYTSPNSFYINGDIPNAGEVTSGVYWETISTPPIGSYEQWGKEWYEEVSCNWAEGKVYASNNRVAAVGGQYWKPSIWVADVTKDLLTGVEWKENIAEPATENAPLQFRTPTVVNNNILLFNGPALRYINWKKIQGNNNYAESYLTQYGTFTNTASVISVFYVSYIISSATLQNTFKLDEDETVFYSSSFEDSYYSSSKLYSFGPNLFYLFNSGQTGGENEEKNRILAIKVGN